MANKVEKKVEDELEEMSEERKKLEETLKKIRTERARIEEDLRKIEKRRRARRDKRAVEEVPEAAPEIENAVEEKPGAAPEIEEEIPKEKTLFEEEYVEEHGELPELAPEIEEIEEEFEAVPEVEEEYPEEYEEKIGRPGVLARIKNSIMLGIENVGVQTADAFIWVSSAVFAFFRIVFGASGGFIGGFMGGVYKKAGHISPKNLRGKVDNLVLYGSLTQDAGKVIGRTIVYSIIACVFASILAFILFNSLLIVLIAFVAGFGIVWLLMYIILNLLADRRAAAIEEVLPDVLLIVSSNMIAGMPPYNALMVAARPEFGPLSEEIQKAVKETMGGTSLAKSLDEMKDRTVSNKLKRAVRLIIQGMKSGGDLPTVLQGISEDIRIEQNIQKEMAANTKAYAMFILFAILIGAPLLLGVSITFVEIFSSILKTINIDQLGAEAGGGAIKIAPLSITPEFFRNYAVLTLGTLGLLGGLLISIIQTGNARSGVTYAPVMAIVAVVIFLVVWQVLISFFGQMIV